MLQIRSRIKLGSPSRHPGVQAFRIFALAGMIAGSVVASGCGPKAQILLRPDPPPIPSDLTLVQLDYLSTPPAAFTITGKPVKTPVRVLLNTEGAIGLYDADLKLLGPLFDDQGAPLGTTSCLATGDPVVEYLLEVEAYFDYLDVLRGDLVVEDLP